MGKLSTCLHAQALVHVLVLEVSPENFNLTAPGCNSSSSFQPVIRYVLATARGRLAFSPTGVGEFDVTPKWSHVGETFPHPVDNLRCVICVLARNHDCRVNDRYARQNLVRLSDLLHLPAEKIRELLLDIYHLQGWRKIRAIS